jgi:hypothetical protein
MATLAELGQHYPCSTQGIAVPLDDKTTPLYPGDVLEIWFTSDRDISIDAAFDCLRDVLKMKEQYPGFVLHYIKVETRKITMQYSIAPPEKGAVTTGISAQITIAVPVLIWLCVLAVIAIIGMVVYVALVRQWILPVKLPTGNATITAKHTETQKGIPGVEIYVDGKYVGKTDGGSVSVKNLGIGDHQFNGATIDGFHPPTPITATIIANQTINVTISYRPSDIPEPKTGYLEVYTSPFSAEVYIDTINKGPSPVAVELAIGNHTVGFASAEGYITPPVQTVTIVGGETTSVTGIYKLPEEEEPWYQTALKYALIGGGIIIGSALLIPSLIRELRRKSTQQ